MISISIFNISLNLLIKWIVQIKKFSLFRLYHKNPLTVKTDPKIYEQQRSAIKPTMCWQLTTRKKIDTGCIRKHVQDAFKIKKKNSIKLNTKKNSIKLNTNRIYYAINLYKVRTKDNS